jgi:hypothetical protein
MWELDGDLEQRSSGWIVIVVVGMIMLKVKRGFLNLATGAIRKMGWTDLGFRMFYCVFFNILAAGQRSGKPFRAPLVVFASPYFSAIRIFVKNCRRVLYTQS